ncbi:Outer membrane receptor proteins, mostly Fe transport [Microbulbifer thermotolerans]|uniref:TonB-dependent receptor domain-containing protein n=1 Tax=Microbulbifer thermotolerans TaxID=252514 RepID=UPI0008F3BC26|nr:TonB-dependent receptor [Microbulbifer thermotolerans]SFB71930.1 Outer membrane receptor proteins, mostly Fe transport [Microbulbifer thermotolerans]
MKREFSHLTFLAAPLALAINAAVAEEVGKAVNTDDKQSTREALEEVIVTGVAQETRKFDATFNINTLDRSDIQQLAPHGTAELLGNIPGFFAEGGTAGETHNNVLVRGLPQAGGYRYVPNLIDGLPVYEEPEAPFMNNDVFIKTDLMTTSVEAVKGGPGAVLYSNALGAAVNYVTRTGTQDFEGEYKAEVGDWGHVRNDFYVAGPINDNFTYAVGGFYRTADGRRDPGFTGNEGGQLRGNILFTSDDARTTLKVQAHVIDDKTIYYQNIPFSVPNNRAPGTESDPFEIDPGSVNSLGVDFGSGTQLSDNIADYTLFDNNGNPLNLDIRNGINPEFDIFSLDVSHDLENGLRFESHFRFTDGSNGFNALFIDPPMETARVTGDQFTRIQSLTGDLGAAYASATEVKAYYADTVTGTDLSSATEAPAILSHNIPVYGKVDATNFTGDVRVSKSFEIASSDHELTLGIYGSDFTYDVFSVFASAWSDIGENARIVDFYAVDAAEQQVGPAITSGGMDQPAIFGLGAEATMKTQAFYLHDHIALLDDRLKLDVGVRWQELDVDRVTTNSYDPGNTSNDFTPDDVVVGSTEDTLADNFVNVPDGVPQKAQENYDAYGWSVGANYLLIENGGWGDVSVFGTVSDSFRLPGFEDYIFGGPATNPSTGEVVRGDLVEDIQQVEGGFRISQDELDLGVSLFYIDFKAKENLGATLDDLGATGYGGIPCSSVPAPADCPKIRDSYRQSVTNIGIELEADYQPSAIPGLRLQGSLVWQDPEQSQDNAIRSGIVEVDTDNDGVNDLREYEVSTSEGRRPRRQSEIMLNFRPAYTFNAIPLTVYGQVQYFSERFASDDSVNVTVYPEYTQVNLGLMYAATENMDIQLHVNNVNDADSFTEGTNITSESVFSDGIYTGVARPLMGRSVKASISYRF